MRRLLIGSLATLTATLAVNVAAATAADLLVLNGDPPVTLSGTQNYGIVYVDGDLRLTGDTAINAASIYIGPDAYIDTCYVPGSGDGQCTAGRSLTLNSSGPLTVATGIDLESGVANGPGGSLRLGGTSVAVGGQIDTSGDTGFGSGLVTISSVGPIATQGIFAPGAPVSITGPGPILVGGAIQTQGAHAPAPGSSLAPMQAGGSVTVAASSGGVDIDGPITTQGQGAPGGGGSGGAGGPVSVSGANIYAESVSTGGGSSQAAGSAPGASGQVSFLASGALTLSGAINTSGASGGGGTGAPGAAVNMRATGPITVGTVDAAGAQTQGGAPITANGASVTAGDLNTSGGGGTSEYRNGANAATISVTAPHGASLGSVLAAGGNSAGSQSVPAAPGAGGAITVSSSAGSISAGRVESVGGNQGVGPGAAGGPINLNAGDDLSVAGDVRSDGSNAGGSWTPPWSGGNAGKLSLVAATGTLSIGGNTSAQGGAGSANSAGSQLGGTGGTGGQITLIAHAVGLLTSLSAAGGPGGGYGNQQGPGGAGGAITAYTNAQIFNSQKLVSTDGGDGNPTGPAGNQVQDSSPASLATTSSGTVSFTTHSPGATHYLLERVGKAGATKVLEKTVKTTDLRPETPVCEKVQLQVVAVSSGVAWTSAPSSPISYTRQPSRSQTCKAPPKLLLPSTLSTTVADAQHSHWVESLRFRTHGVGAVKATLRYRTLTAGQATVTAKLTITKAGVHVLRFKLPTTVHGAGSGSVKLAEISPDRRHRSTHNVKVEVSA